MSEYLEKITQYVINYLRYLLNNPNLTEQDVMNNKEQILDIVIAHNYETRQRLMNIQE